MERLTPPQNPAVSSAMLSVEVAGPLREGLRLMALRALGDPGLAEEAAQEAMSRALVALNRPSPAPVQHLGAFVHGIARNVIADMRRAGQRSVGPEGLAFIAAPGSVDPLAQLVRDEDARRVRAALGELASADREILRLSYEEGLTPAEIAARLGEPAERIRKRKSRALERLREVFFAFRSAGHDRPPRSTDPKGAPGVAESPASPISSASLGST